METKIHLNIDIKLCVKIFLDIIISAVLTILLLKYLNKGVSVDFSNVIINYLHGKPSIYIDKMIIIYILFVYIGLHFIFDIKKMYKLIFDKRWLFAGLMLLFIVVGKYNGDSISIYNKVIQPGIGSDYIDTVIGESRSIRSDEWLVDTPSKLSSHYGNSPYSKYNIALRGTDTLNSITGIYFDYSTIGKSIFNFAFPMLGVEYGMSFAWYAPIILLFMVTIEMMLIITKRKKLLSVAGAFLVVFSSFYLWWNFPSQLLSLQAAIVCMYHFINSKSKYCKIGFLVGLVLAGANFITVLYPAWQVPMGFVGLVFMVWVIHDNFEKIKEMKKFDYISIAIAFISLIIIVVSYFYKNIEYVQAISSTVYPGSRKDYGGYGIEKIFYYVQAIFYAYFDMENPSEAGVFLSLFPIPLIMSSYLWIKSKKKDILTGGLLLISFLFLIYVIMGMVPILATITLMTFTMPYRLIDIIGFIQVYLIIIVLSRYNDIKRPNIWISSILGVITVVVCCFISNRYFPGYMSTTNMITGSVIVLVLCVLLMVAKTKDAINLFCFIAIGVSIYTGIGVRPITKGLDAIYSKPVAKVIEQIDDNDSDAKWLANGGGNILPSYAVACGAPTLNSVNIYPNMDMWKTLDPRGDYNDVYNRYAHINLNLTEADTSMSLLSNDYIQLNLSYKDIKKIGVKYILSLVPLKDNSDVKFDCLYSEYGSYIYSVK